MSIVVVAISYLTYYFICKNSFVFKALIKSFGEEKGQLRHVLFQRLTGVICFGLIPFATIIFTGNKSLNLYGLSVKNLPETLIWLLAVAPLIVFINFKAAQSTHNLAMYPQMRVKEWNLSLFAVSTLSWLVYLFAYEFMFRGFLFFSCLGGLSLIPVIAINTLLYALAHVTKGLKETAGAIPFGILLCIVTFRTETIWFAFGIHSFLALSNEWFSIRYHPEMKVSLWQNL
jgi:membrane protease YdiL (CAAX protease family)